MAPRKILSLILTFTLLLPLSVWGESLAPSSSILLALLNQHREIKTGVGNIELMSKYGKSLVDLTFKEMKNPKNKAFLSTPEGRELRGHQQMLANFLVVKDHFAKCIKDKDAKRKLHERVLQASFQSLNVADLSVPCDPDMNKMPNSYLQFNNDIMKSMKTMVRPYFQNQLTKQVMINTAKSLLGFKVKFQEGFMKNGKLSDKELQDILNAVCVKTNVVLTPVSGHKNDVCSKMDPNFKTRLSRELSAFSETQKGVEKLSPEKATKSLNAAIGRLNSALLKISVKKDVGYIYDSANLSDEKTRKEFDFYISEYMKEVSSGAGPLLLSQTIQDEAGQIKSFKSDDVSKVKSRFQFNTHKEVRVSDVEEAMAEVEKKILSQSRDTLEMGSDATRKKGLLISDEDHIQELVKINPFAGGQVLLHEPQYAGLMCDAINDINQNDVDGEARDKYFAIGSAILGGALLLTGVGTVAGGYILTGSLTAGLAAGTTGATVLGYVAVAGTASEMVNLSYRGKRAYDHYSEMNRQEEAYLTNNSDNKAILDAKASLVEFKEARLAAGISLAGLGFNAFNAGKFFNLMKANSGKVSALDLNAATKILKYLADHKAAQKIKDVASSLGDKGMEKIDLFLLALAKVGEANRVRFLELLSDSKVLPQKIKSIIDDALEALNNCDRI